MAWIVVKVKDRRYQLLTGPGEWTDIIVRKDSHANVFLLMKMMEVHDVPIQYARFLKKITFATNLDGDTGRYYADRLFISGKKSDDLVIDAVLCHELAHHIVDRSESIISPRLREEFKTKSHLMPDRYAKQSVHEYFAVGFEIYYFSSASRKLEMKRCNPVLYNTIKNTHNFYSSSGIMVCEKPTYKARTRGVVPGAKPHKHKDTR